MKKFGLPLQILTGLFLGIIVGAIFYKNPEVETYLKPLGDIFLHLIKMVVVPIVISSIVVGVAGLGNAKKLGTLGFKTILYFEIVTTLAIVLGILIANVFQPGTGVNLSELTKGDISSYVQTEQEIEKGGHLDFIVNIVPTNIFESMANGQLLSIIFFSVLFGLGVAAIGEKGQPILQFFTSVSHAMFYVVGLIMKVAPFGVFGLIGVTVSKFGLNSLIPLGKLILVTYGAMFFFVVVCLGSIAKLFKVDFIKMLKLLKDELILVFSTATSETVLPKLMEKLERFGCPKSIVSFVIPIGYSFNLDGSTLYQAIAAIFISQLYGIDMSLTEQITLVLILMLTSKGIAGVAGASFVVLLATLGSAGLPLEGLAFIAGVDFLLNMGRATVNVVGNALAAVVITKSENQFDYKKNQHLVLTNKEVI
ncbi:cation:dicarboxylate symporter family transporter [Bacillus bingmayongensis]|uniref:cation:dicarboxylate symporter family transporter n=1 Tax=Bacillus bingmayongensis TaxID=1150157 RepID=UPI0002F5234E|nr:cation:dicarboxylase symporter family transporter [Bacillus bingmayongensis]MBY0595895.1 cation:dicarboxylase symporter family transporter [Bacillus bingmayongensis]